MKEILQNLGLSPKEIRIYLSVLHNSPMKTSQISREVSIPSQSINSTLLKLVELGFVEQGNERGVKRYFADARDLLVLVDRRSQILNKERRKLEKELPRYLDLEMRSKKFPRTTYYEGREGQKRLFEGILEYWKGGAEKRFRGYGIRIFPQDLRKDFFKWIKERHKLGVKSQVIIGNGPKTYSISGKSNELGRVVKNIDINAERASLLIVGNRIYTFSFENNIGVMIEEPAIADLLKSVFDDHWKSIPS